MTGWYRCEDCGAPVSAEPDPRIEVDGTIHVHCKSCDTVQGASK